MCASTSVVRPTSPEKAPDGKSGKEPLLKSNVKIDGQFTKESDSMLAAPTPIKLSIASLGRLTKLFDWILTGYASVSVLEISIATRRGRSINASVGMSVIGLFAKDTVDNIERFLKIPVEFSTLLSSIIFVTI